MSILMRSTASRLQLDGLLKKIYGLLSLDLRGDQIPYFIQSGRIPFNTANAAAFVLPGPMKLVAVTTRVIVQQTSADCVAQIGTQAGATAIGSRTMATTEVAGLYEWVMGTDVSAANQLLTKGDQIVWGVSNAGASGVFSSVAVLIPR